MPIHDYYHWVPTSLHHNDCLVSVKLVGHVVHQVGHVLVGTECSGNTFLVFMKALLCLLLVSSILGLVSGWWIIKGSFLCFLYVYIYIDILF